MKSSDSYRNRQKSYLRRLAQGVLVALAVLVLAGAGHFIYRHYLITNFDVVIENSVYRAALPKPAQLAKWRKDYGIKTVINLRGESEDPEYLAERDRSGLVMSSVNLSASALPPVHKLNELMQTLETAVPPILLHCLGGSDRTGVASVIAQMALAGAPYETAIDQISIKYLQIDRRPNQIVGVFRLYEQWCEQNGLTTAGYEQFKTWATTIYHPAYYRACITAPPELVLKPDEQVIIPVTVENCSNETLPAADSDRVFVLAVFSGSSIEQTPDEEHGPRMPLPRRNLAPGEKVVIAQPLIAPSHPGHYLIHHDLIEEKRTWFARQGSPVSTTRLTVE